MTHMMIAISAVLLMWNVSQKISASSSVVSSSSLRTVVLADCAVAGATGKARANGMQSTRRRRRRATSLQVLVMPAVKRGGDGRAGKTLGDNANASVY